MGQPRPALFVPSQHAFGFANAWPDEPALSLLTPVRPIRIGNAARGLCGGMVFATLDYWHAGAQPPATMPTPGEPLFRFIVWRLIQSWHVPTGVARYYYWMTLPDGDDWRGLSRRAPARRMGLQTRTMAAQWPQIRAQLDAGQPTAIGLVTVAGANPLQLGRNHQVLAYSYQVAGSRVSLQVYDPNSGPADDIYIRFDTVAPHAGFTHSVKIGLPVRGFFLTPYFPVQPPAAVTHSR
ncbi:MAG TPA: hypothetical protein VLM11_18380 [Streptosporangiaceae bacterium]|nr:hypothetical protein [Streptosporangiaceae bacterium]